MGGERGTGLAKDLEMGIEIASPWAQFVDALTMRLSAHTYEDVLLKGSYYALLQSLDVVLGVY